MSVRHPRDIAEAFGLFLVLCFIAIAAGLVLAIMLNRSYNH